MGRLLFFAFNHGVGIFAPVLFFSWRQLGLHFLLYCASGMGITYSYHRQLAHRSFKSKKWLEYLACTCGMLAMQVRVRVRARARVRIRVRARVRVS